MLLCHRAAYLVVQIRFAPSAYHEGMNTRLALRAPPSIFISTILLLGAPLLADQVPVRHIEGRIHGFLVLRDLDDNILASGELIQLLNGNRVTTELSFHFKDGSIHEETAVFSQRHTFQLLTLSFGAEGESV